MVQQTRILKHTHQACRITEVHVLFLGLGVIGHWRTDHQARVCASIARCHFTGPDKRSSIQIGEKHVAVD